MQKDFHYYMTYMAARAAGIAKSRSRRMAEWAEVIDEAFNGTWIPGYSKEGLGLGDLEKDANKFDLSKNWAADSWNPTVAGLREGRVHRTVTSTKVTRLGPRVKLGSVGRDAIPWIAFHFLPGIEEVDGVRNPYKFNIRRRLEILQIWHDKAWGKGSNSAGQIANLQKYFHADGAQKMPWDSPYNKMEKLICWPNSQTAKRMIGDTKRCVKHVTSGQHLSECFSALGDFGNDVTQKARLFSNSLGEMGLGKLSPEGFIEALLGVRMHVYVDTWAHQGMMGANIPATNATDAVKATFKRKELTRYKVELHGGGIAGKMRERINLGHAQLDSFPDHPAINFQWTRVWDGNVFTRNNPQEYTAAYRAMYDVFVGAGARLGWTRPSFRGRSFDDGQGSPVRAWEPDRINEAFFRTLLMPGSTGDFGEEKKWRCNQIFRDISQEDGKVLLPFGSVCPDFGVIRHVYMTRRIDLGYFSLAALYHQRWVEKQIANGLGYGQFDTQVETIARNCGSADGSIRKALDHLRFAARPALR